MEGMKFCFFVIVGIICPDPKPIPVDGFCSEYQKVIVNKGDADIRAPLAVKQRILANELHYGNRRCGEQK